MCPAPPAFPPHGPAQPRRRPCCWPLACRSPLPWSLWASLHFRRSTDRRLVGQLDQRVALFARAQLDWRDKGAGVQHQARIGQRRVIQPGAIFGDQALCLFARFGKARSHYQLQNGDPIRQLQVRQIVPEPPLSNTSRAVASAAAAASAPWQSVVTALASAILASLISDPDSAPSHRVDNAVNSHFEAKVEP